MIKHNLKLVLLLATLICANVKAQKVNVNWTDFYTNNTGFVIGNWLETDNKFFFLMNDSRFDHKPVINLVRFDKDLHLEKIMPIPGLFNNEKIIYEGIILSGNELVLSAKYLETKGTNRYVMIKAIADKELTKTVNFEKVMDIEIKSFFNQTTDEDKQWINGNKILVKTIPREGLKDKNMFKYEIFDNKLENKEWSANIDLTQFMKDYEMVSYQFTEKRDFIFLLRSQLKFLKRTKDEFILGKYTKEKGIEIKQFDFGKDRFITDLDLIIDEGRNYAFVRTSFSTSDTKRNEFNIKKFEIGTFTEILNKMIDFGPSSSKCFKGSASFFGAEFRFDDYTMKYNSIDKVTGELKVIGELKNPYKVESYRDEKGNLMYKGIFGLTGNIVIFKMDSSGNYTTQVIPHKVTTTSYSNEYSTFYLTEYQNKDCYLIYDDIENANNTPCNEEAKTKVIKDDSKKMQLFIVLVDKDNKIKKIKPVTTYKGEGKFFKKYVNFDLVHIRPISDGRYLVFSDKLFGIMTIE